MVIKGIRLMLLAMSFYGYVFFLRRKVRIEFSIGIVFSVIGNLLVLAGILNILKEVSLVLFLGGLALAGRSLVQKDRFKGLLCAGILFFVLMCAGLLLLLYGSRFTSFDNFTHWATIAQYINITDRFPNFSDWIEYPSYPLGSAAFIYHFMHITGLEADWIMMYAQAIFMGGMLTSLFAFSKNKVSDFFTALVAMVVLVGNIPLTEILVDSLLPITAVGAIAFCMYYADSLGDKVLWLIPYTCYLMMVKNSGVFFVVLICIYALLYVKKTKGNLYRWAACAGAPYFMRVLWDRHTDIVFSNAAYSGHAMTGEYLAKIYQEKTPTLIRGVIQEVCTHTFSISNGFWFLLIAALLLLAVSCLFSREAVRQTNQTVVFMIIVYMAYQLGLLFMYLFSMPITEDNLYLASYSRYHKTVLIFLASVLWICALRIMGYMCGKWKGTLVACLLGCMCVALSGQSVNFRLSHYTRQDIEGTVRDQFDQILHDYNVWPYGRYLILVDENHQDSGYLNYMARYLLKSNHYRVLKASEARADDDVFMNCEFLIDFDQTEEIDAFIEEQLGQSGQRVYWLPSFF